MYLSMFAAFGYFYFCENNWNATAVWRLLLAKHLAQNSDSTLLLDLFGHRYFFWMGTYPPLRAFLEKELALQLFTPPQEDLQDRFEKFLWSLYLSKHKDNKDCDCKGNANLTIWPACQIQTSLHRHRDSLQGLFPILSGTFASTEGWSQARLGSAFFHGSGSWDLISHPSSLCLCEKFLWKSSKL